MEAEPGKIPISVSLHQLIGTLVLPKRFFDSERSANFLEATPNRLNWILILTTQRFGERKMFLKHLPILIKEVGTRLVSIYLWYSKNSPFKLIYGLPNLVAYSMKLTCCFLLFLPWPLLWCDELPKLVLVILLPDRVRLDLGLDN